MEKIILGLMLFIILGCSQEIKKEKTAAITAISQKENREKYVNIENGITKIIRNLDLNESVANKTIAIGKIGDEKNSVSPMSKTIAENIEKIIINNKSKKYKVADRYNIEEIINEWKLGQAGVIDSENAYQTSKLLQLDVIMFGTYEIKENIMRLGIKIVDTKNGEIVGSDSEVIVLDQENIIIKPIEKIKNENENGKIELWSEKSEYKLGEKVKIFFKTENDCYLTLIDISPGGEASIIFPNEYSKSNYVKGGKPYQIPSEEAGFEIEASEPRGIEVIRAIASEKPLINIEEISEKTTKESPFGTIKGDFTELSRGLNIKEKEAKKGEWSEKIIRIKIN